MQEENTGILTSEHLDLDQFLDSIPTGHRLPRFRALAEAMLFANRPILLVETGCMRAPTLDPPGVDGCSTLVWDYIAQRTKGKAVSIDVNPENVAYTRKRVGPYTQVICSESVKILSGATMSQPIDFLYLDSMDFLGDALERAKSALHHAAELAVAWPLLAPGALIAVDDCVGEYAGKHALVKRFFDMAGIEPLADDYIHVWRKPLIEPIPSPVVLCK
jgi:hypothetical protein